MNYVEALSYIRGVRKEVKPVPSGDDLQSIAERQSISEYVQEKRSVEPEYTEALVVFKAIAKRHLDNLKILDEKGQHTEEPLARNAYAYISGLVEHPRIPRVFQRDDSSYITIFTPYAEAYYESGYISPDPNLIDRTTVVELRVIGFDDEGDRDDMLLEDYYLVDGRGIDDQAIHLHNYSNIPQPPIFTGVKSVNPDAYVGIDDIAAFLHRETGWVVPQA